jgi:hypothetical protein
VFETIPDLIEEMKLRVFSDIIKSKGFAEIESKSIVEKGSDQPK